MNRERTREGVARAKAEGKYKGRPQTLSPADAAQLQRMHETGSTRPQSLAGSSACTARRSIAILP